MESYPLGTTKKVYLPQEINSKIQFYLFFIIKLTQDSKKENTKLSYKF